MPAFLAPDGKFGELDRSRRCGRGRAGRPLRDRGRLPDVLRDVRPALRRRDRVTGRQLGRRPARPAASTSARALARHPRARDDEIEAGLLGRGADVGLDVRVERERRRRRPASAARARSARPASAVRSTTSTSASRQLAPQVGRPARTSWPAALQRPDDVRAEQQVGDERDDARHAPLLRAEPLELLAHRLGPAPHLRHLDPAGADLADRQLAVDPGVVEQLQRRWTAGAAAAWPKRWATSSRQCQSCLEYGWALQVTSSTAAST